MGLILLSTEDDAALGDIVIGELLGDLELLVVAEDGTVVLVAFPWTLVVTDVEHYWATRTWKGHVIALITLA